MQLCNKNTNDNNSNNQNSYSYNSMVYHVISIFVAHCILHLAFLLSYLLSYFIDGQHRQVHTSLATCCFSFLLIFLLCFSNKLELSLSRCFFTTKPDPWPIRCLNRFCKKSSVYSQSCALQRDGQRDGQNEQTEMRCHY